jgi:putative ABC transport system substrate-binding protein
MDRWSRRRFVQGAGVAGLAVLAGCGRLPGQAQPARVPRLGYLGLGVANASFDEPFRRGLRDLGYVDGENLVMEFRIAQGESYEDVMASANELVVELIQLPVDVIVAGLGQAAGTVTRATKTTPIVILTSQDPVLTHTVASLAHPGGNVTGLSLLSTELAGKRLELLHATMPRLSRAAALLEPSSIQTYELEATQTAAEQLGVELVPWLVREPGELDSSFARLPSQGVGGLVVFTHEFATRYSREIATAATKNGLAAMFGERLHAVNGGLISYGPSSPAAFYRGAYYVDRILKGAKPADLPLEQPMTFECVINLKAALALGLTIPEHVLLQATEVFQ